jgi:predicted nucleic acid-binding protein
MRLLLDTCVISEMREADVNPAIALRHGLHLVTRDAEDFKPTGVLFIDPWAN